MQEKRLYTVQEVASYLQVSVKTLYKWKSQRKINIIKIMGCARITEKELNRIIEESNQDKEEK